MLRIDLLMLEFPGQLNGFLQSFLTFIRKFVERQHGRLFSLKKFYFIKYAIELQGNGPAIPLPPVSHTPLLLNFNALRF